MANGGYEGPERRSEEWSRWRGGIEVRVGALETTVAGLATSHLAIQTKQIQIEVQVKALRDDLQAATSAIEQGREQTVRELKDSIKTGGLQRWQRWQVVIATVVAVAAPVIATLITLAIVGGGKP